MGVVGIWVEELGRKMEFVGIWVVGLGRNGICWDLGRKLGRKMGFNRIWVVELGRKKGFLGI